jgi:orotate phosphoribosyltransferase
MDALAECSSDLALARERLIEQLKEHALQVGEFTLTSGARAQYYVDAKRAILRAAGFAAVGALIADRAREWDASAVGGMTMGADPLACAALAAGAAEKAFIVRKQAKPHGLQRRIEGAQLHPHDRCLVVEDVVTTGGSTLAAIEALHEEGLRVCGVVCVLDRLTGAAETIAAAAGAPFATLTTIDDVYPERPDRTG